MGKRAMHAITAGQFTETGKQTPDRGASLRITVGGDLTDDARVLELNRACLDSLGRPIRKLIVDVAGVTHSDTKLIAVLISLYANCRRKRIELELDLSASIIAWLGIYDLQWMADVCAPTLEP